MKTAASILLVALLIASPFDSRTLAQGKPENSRALAQGKPKLVVFIAVDQMRADYIDKFQQQWTAGLKRLVNDGAWFRQADYPYYNTVTCSGHASMSTGTVPAVHGMALNTWWERDNSRLVNCTDDDNQL